MRWFRWLRYRPCEHKNITSAVERVGQRLVHVQDTCRDCGWKSPRFDQPGKAIEFYRKKLGI